MVSPMKHPSYWLGACEGCGDLRALCCICGQAITETFWACKDCEAQYGLTIPFAAWPEWAKFLANEEHTRRRRRDHTIQGIPVSALSESEGHAIERELYGEPNDDTY